MKLTFAKYPIDILLCMIWSLLLVPSVLLSLNDALLIILGIPFLLFIPGYLLIFNLFPMRKTERGIDVIERIALSFGLSIAIVALIGLALNYTPWGINLQPILTALFCTTILLGFTALYRWRTTTPTERFIISVDISLPKQESALDRTLTIILVILILIAILSFIYVIVSPKTGEKFTEFYLLGPDGIAERYPNTLTVGENATIIIGVANHEYQTINYTIEVWLINQTMRYNETAHQNETIYHHMWFIDTMSIMLPYTPIKVEVPWTPQWQLNYTFNITRAGTFKLAFLLYSTPTEPYNYDQDYHNIAEQKITNAYRETHLWITVS